MEGALYIRGEGKEGWKQGTATVSLAEPPYPVLQWKDKSGEWEREDAVPRV